jgi:sugar O-acyltransferase (sialic acid O-acetyltransferase NeuD family)
MSEGLLIIGAGGHGKVVADAAHQQGAWKNLAFLDDDPRLTGTIVGRPVLGVLQATAELRHEYPDAVVAIGSAELRLRLMDDLRRQGFKLPVVQHPSASISPFAALQEGCVVFAQSAINADTTLGRGCIVNTGATIDHDCAIADGVHVSPGAHLAGGVRIGRASWIGIGACVRENIVVGGQVTVGAGAAVVKDVEQGLTVVGVPAASITPMGGRP